MRNDFPINDDEKAAISWCKHVDGVDIYPKLPVHMRIHKEEFERGQRVRSCMRKAKDGKESLDELNRILVPGKPSTEQPVADPEPMPDIPRDATHNLPYIVTAGTAVGSIPAPSRRKRTGERGRDKPGKVRAPRRCRRCLQFGGGYPSECEGRRREREKCEYFDSSGVRRCGRCFAFGRRAHAYNCKATKGNVKDCEYFDNSGAAINI